MGIARVHEVLLRHGRRRGRVDGAFLAHSVGTAAFGLRRPNDRRVGRSADGLLFAWALLFPDRQILFMFFFPLPSRIFVLIMG
jgi:hypothetical protein